MKNRYLYITLLAVMGFSTEIKSEEARPQSVPRLIINIVIDQLRTDYMEAFSPLYSDGGLKRLLNEGKVFVNASYPFMPVDRASAIAAIATGTTPYYNSIVGWRWLNRETLRPVGCVDDPQFTGIFTSEKVSPSGISTSSFGDELKVATGGKSLVYAIAPYSDAAILSAGHAGDAAFWIDDAQGEWCSSSYYQQTLPMWLQNYNSQQALARKINGISWDPLHEFSGAFNYFLQANSNNKPFKHKFSGDSRFLDFKESALINAEITDMAQYCIGHTGIGTDKIPDLLCLTYYAGTFGHQRVTDCQMELQDTYVRLDRELSKLMAYTDHFFGRNEVLYVVTSTGYNDVETSDYDSFRIPTGTFYMNRTANLMNMYMGAIWGQGNYVEATFRNHIFLNHKLLETKKISISEATSRAQEIGAMMSGVRNVYTSLQLLTSQNTQIERIRNAFHPERCGDVIIEVAPGWRILNEDTQQSELSIASFTPFPIIFCGSGMKAERIATPVTTDRIAPTLARTIRIRAPNACSSEPLF